jgi:histidine kinase
LAVVAFTGVSTVLTLQYFLRNEMQFNQETWFASFRSSTTDALYLGDDLAIQAASESLEKSIPELAYAVFVDNSRKGLVLGGMESVQRFGKLSPACPQLAKSRTEPFMQEEFRQDNRWRHYCAQVEQTNIRGDNAHGLVFLGFNVNLLEAKLGIISGRFWPRLLWSLIAVLSIGVAITFLYAKRLTRPIFNLTEGAKSIGEGQWDTRIPVESKDELGFLAHEFNLMAMKLKELDQLKDDFVSSVSHELRSPLAAIAGYAELLRSKPLDQISVDKREKALSIIQESTERLAHFINDILDLAKLKSGHVEIRRRPFNVKVAIDEITGLLAPLFEKKQIPCIIDVPDNLPTLQADHEKIKQVFTNLLSNALKFTPAPGKIRISAKNQGEFIHIAVKDSGTGIPEDQKEAVFERFRQVKSDGEIVTGQKGTGLGLAIAKGNVEAHGGRIWIESEVGKGTTVNFTLPAAVES